VQRLSNIPVSERLALLAFSTCRPLRDAKEATEFAIQRFHESWHTYRTVTPTLYLISDHTPGTYLTLGQVRKKYGLSWDTLEAVLEAVEQSRSINGYLLAAPGVGGEPLRPLFTLHGHAWGEVHQGALDLTHYTPFETAFTTELESDGWQDLWHEAATNANLTQKRS
jgi:hypothetical protein